MLSSNFSVKFFNNYESDVSVFFSFSFFSLKQISRNAYLFVIHIDETRVHEKVGIRPRAVTYKYLFPFLEIPQCVTLATISRCVEIRRDLRRDTSIRGSS